MPVVFSRSYGGPCEAGFGLAGVLRGRFLTLARSATLTREKVGWRFLNTRRSIRKMRYPPFTQGLRPGLSVLSFTSSLEVRHD